VPRPGTQTANAGLSTIKLHLDEDADAHALLKALRHRGLDVSSSRELGLLRLSDEEQRVCSKKPTPMGIGTCVAGSRMTRSFDENFTGLAL
jgi:hypothetical protein